MSNDGSALNPLFPKKLKFRSPQEGRSCAQFFGTVVESISQIELCKVYYRTLLDKLRDAIIKKRRGMLVKWPHLLGHNAPNHVSQIAVEKVRQCSYAILLHPHYSPNLASSDRFWFPEMKNPLWGHRFDNTDDVIQKVEQWISTLSADFDNNNLLKFKKRWGKCMTLDGDL